MLNDLGLDSWLLALQDRLGDLYTGQISRYFEKTLVYLITCLGTNEEVLHLVA
jgi:hypothetical protein